MDADFDRSAVLNSYRALLGLFRELYHENGTGAIKPLIAVTINDIQIVQDYMFLIAHPKFWRVRKVTYDDGEVGWHARVTIDGLSFSCVLSPASVYEVERQHPQGCTCIGPLEKCEVCKEAVYEYDW